jgi:hypothetical protein
MVETKKINPAAVIALKEALSSIYWYKDDLRSFLSKIIKSSNIIGRVNWHGYKREIADFVIEELINEDGSQSDLINLFTAVVNMRDFSHLEYLEDGKEKVKKAISAVNALKAYTSGFLELRDDREKIDKNRKEYLQKIDNVNLFSQKLNSIKDAYCQLVIEKDFQKRGYKLESILKELFDLFDLDPKASFKVEGEQIDGAFTFEGTDFLFEGKWQNELVRASDLDQLSSKIQRKLDNTLGLFLSINGFSKDGISAHSTGKKVLLLVDGSDIMAVLENRISFNDLLRRKRRHASQTGEIFLSFRDMC